MSLGRRGPDEAGCDLPVFLNQGLWSLREFIAVQDPLPHTVGDFWRLV